MSRVNQGYYKGITNQYNELMDEINSICFHSVFDIEGDRDDYFYRLCNLNDAYVKSKELIDEIEGMLRSQKFEDEKIVIKYEEYVSSLSSKLYDIESNYCEIKKVLENQYSDSEKYTLSRHVLR